MMYYLLKNHCEYELLLKLSMVSKSFRQVMSWLNDCVFVPKQIGVRPDPRVCHTACMYNNYLYIYGGDEPPINSQNFGQIRKDMFRYNTENGDWEIVPVSGLRSSTEHGSVLVDNIWYHIGGYQDRGYTMDIYSFNLDTNEYRRVENTNSISYRSSDCCIYHNRCIYVYGGWNGSKTHDEFYKFNIDTRSWIKIENVGDCPGPRRAYSAVKYLDDFLVICGYDGSENCSSELYAFDFNNEIWRLVPTTGEKPIPRSRAKMVHCHNKLAIFGGWDRFNYFNDYYELDFNTYEWTKVKKEFPSPFGQFSTTLKLHPYPRIFTFGGHYTNLSGATNRLLSTFI